MRTYLQTGRSLAIALLVISGAVLLFAPVAHAIFVIDDFSEPTSEDTVAIGQYWPHSSPAHLEEGDSGTPGNMLGGQRDLLFEVTGDATALGAFAAKVGEGRLEIGGFESYIVTAQYDGFDTDTLDNEPPWRLLPDNSTMSSTADLVTNPSGGADHEAFAFIFGNSGGTVELDITVQSDDGNVSKYSNPSYMYSGPATSLIMFDDEIGWDHPYGLDIPDPDAADFKNVERLEFRWTALPGTSPDLILESIGTRMAIPEPGSMLLAVFGGLCLVGCRRRRHHKA